MWGQANVHGELNMWSDRQSGQTDRVPDGVARQTESQTECSDKVHNVVRWRVQLGCLDRVVRN